MMSHVRLSFKSNLINKNCNAFNLINNKLHSSDFSAKIVQSILETINAFLIIAILVGIPFITRKFYENMTL